MSTQLVLGVAGAVVGSFFGMPQLGWMAGVMLAGVVDPTIIKNEGPRLADLKIQTSTWGKMIPIVYGRARIAGNVLWASDIRETRHTEGGKGGPQMENTYYTYAADIAVSLCAGPIFGVRKIWANGKLIFNNDPSAGPQTLLNNDRNDIFIYTGTESQLPDPTMEAAKGVGNVPAYRGQAYIVFVDFPLADYGNRIPNFEFEPVQQGTALSYREVASVSPTGTTLDGRDVPPNKFLVLSVEDGVMRVCRRSASAVTQGVTVFTLDGRYVGKDAFRAREFDLRFLFPGIIGFTDTYLFYIDANPGKPTPNPNYNWTRLWVNGQIWEPSQIAANEIVMGAVLSADKKVIMVMTKTFTIGATLSNSGKWYQFKSDKTFIRSGNVPLYGSSLANLEATSGVWYASFGCLALESDYDYLWNAGNFDCELYQIQSNGDLTKIYNGSLSYVFDDCSLYAENGVAMVYFDQSFKAFSRIPTVAPATVALSTVVLDQCSRAGISAADVDVSSLTDAVTGFIVGAQGAARNNLTPLQKTYFFDSVESESKLKFKKRGSTPVLTIPYDDLAAQMAPGNAEGIDPLKITRIQESDLPVSVAVRYYDANGDYQVGTESTRRLLAKASQQMTEELAVVITKDKAAQVAEVLMYDAHVARTGFQFQTSRKYAHIEPTDVVLVQSPTTSYRMRVVKKTDDDGLIKFDAVAEDGNVYTSSAVGGTQLAVQTTISTPGITKLEFMDIPILRDDDNNAGLYIGMTGYLDTWKGATLYRAEDNLSFAPLGSVQNKCVMGTTTTVLGSWPGQNFVDESSVVEVIVIAGTLSSVPHIDLFSGANAALIGNEIVQFRTATLIAANTYRLSGMLRGRFGTGNQAASHAAGERFVLLGQSGTLRVNEGTTAINVTRYYKGLSFGQKLAKASSYSFANTAKGLKPLQPVHFYATRLTNNDWNLRWVRRTRVDGSWRDLVDVALGETSESYEVEIMNGATVVRTIASATPTVTYTAAQQNTDFGSVRTTITARLYQLSASVGRSDVLQQTFP